MFGYRAYIIEERNNKGFHAFCKEYVNDRWFYIDARGITSSFSEFMIAVEVFVHEEYIIRPIKESDIAEWDEYAALECPGHKMRYIFVEEIIKKYRECYIF